MTTRLLRLLCTILFLAAAATASAASLTYSVPDGWRTEQPRSSMRLAQFTLPKAAGDADDATAVIFFFGEGQGGGVDANLERWAGQMGQAGGRPGTVKDGKKTTFTANGHTVTIIDIGGTYTDMMSGASAKTGYRMKAAVVETPGGAYFVKLTGPDKTVARWDASFTTFLKSFNYR
jgi:hypothetical protein